MYKIINSDDYDIHSQEENGVTRDKLWVINESGEKVLFKPNASKYKYAHICEKATYELAKIMNVPCAKTELAERFGKIGILSYSFLKGKDKFKDGVKLIQEMKQGQNTEISKNTLNYLNENGYSIKQVIGLLKKYGIEKEGLDMLFMDSLIGHSDRHAGNWGIVKREETGEVELAPMFDNSATFSLNLNNNRIKRLLKLKEKNYEEYKKEIIGFGKSKIYINESTEKDFKGVEYSRVNEYLFKRYPDESKDFIKRLQNEVINDKIEEISKNIKPYIEDEYVTFFGDYIQIRKENLVLEYEKYREETKVKEENIFVSVPDFSMSLINYDSVTNIPKINIHKEIINEEEKEADLSLNNKSFIEFNLEKIKNKNFVNLKKIMNIKNEGGNYNERL